MQLMYWAIAFLVEKILILYISIHFHYRSDMYRIQRSKLQHEALSCLYEASIYHYPVYSEKFMTEDLLIHSHRAPIEGSARLGAAKFLQKIGIVGDEAFAFFFQAAGADRDSHWGKANATYAIIERALSDPRSAAALANRIWISLAAAGRNSLTVNDVAEAYGPHRREEAERCFQLLDENDNHDILLSEFIPTVVEIGRERHAIYAGMHDLNHIINTFDWVALLIIAIVMIYFIRITSLHWLRRAHD